MNSFSLPCVLTSRVIDIQPRNILFGFFENSELVQFERDEKEYPSPRKELSTHTVYLARTLPLTSKDGPRLSDFSEARFDSPQNDDPIMPDVYRAPEVMLGLPWSYPVDLWGFAMTVSIILGVSCF
jgi:serine/threonine-protein kinase SRPK3